jgi:hypothetical protein
MSDEGQKGKVIEIGPVERGNTGELGRVVIYEVDGPLGPMPVADWEAVEEVEVSDG